MVGLLRNSQISDTDKQTISPAIFVDFHIFILVSSGVCLPRITLHVKSTFWQSFQSIQLKFAYVFLTDNEIKLAKLSTEISMKI